MARRQELARGGDLVVSVTTEGTWCPVCGITLSPSDISGPDEDYYCPYCTTRKKPPRLSVMGARSGRGVVREPALQTEG